MGDKQKNVEDMNIIELRIEVLKLRRLVVTYLERVRELEKRLTGYHE